MPLRGPVHVCIPPHASLQAEVFSRVIALGGIVGTFGPAVGGLFYGKLGPTFPALGPSLVGGALGLFAVACTAAFLPETRPAGYLGGQTGHALPPANDVEDGADGAGPAAGAKPQGLLAVVCQRPLPLAIFLRSVLGCVQFGYLDVVPLWAIASEGAGGLNFQVPAAPLRLSLTARPRIR